MTMADQDAPISSGANDPAAYEVDYAAWVLRQVELINAQRWSELDRDRLADEVGSLERQSFDELVAAVKCVVRQMLTWDVQEDERSQDWARRIEADRGDILQELSDSPSYSGRRREALEQAYDLARFEMSQEDKLPYRLFPERCPYAWEDVLTRRHSPATEPEPKFHCFTSQ